MLPFPKEWKRLTDVWTSIGVFSGRKYYSKKGLFTLIYVLIEIAFREILYFTQVRPLSFQTPFFSFLFVFSVFLTTPADFGKSTHCFVFLKNNKAQPLHIKSAAECGHLGGKKNKKSGFWNMHRKKMNNYNQPINLTGDCCSWYFSIIDGWPCHIFIYSIRVGSYLLPCHGKLY